MTDSRFRTSKLARRGAATFALLALLWLTSPAAARATEPAEPTEKPSSVRLTVENGDGSKVDLSVGTGWLSGLLARAEIECDASSDRRTRQMMESLTEQGEGGVWKGRGEDGDRILARRSRGQLKLETVGRDGERALIEMPWPAAECLLLGRNPEGGVGSAFATGTARLHIDAQEDGKRVRLSFE